MSYIYVLNLVKQSLCILETQACLLIKNGSGVQPYTAVCVLGPWREWQWACCQTGSHTDCRSTSQHLNEGSSIHLWTPHLQRKHWFNARFHHATLC